MNDKTKKKTTDLEVVQGMFQTFKSSHIGIPNTSEAVYYTQQEADAYNAELTGALDSTTPLTAEQAAAYNEAITGATKEAGDTLSAEEAAAYNATLDGAVTTEDVKTPAVPKKVKDYVDDGLNGKADKTTTVNGHALGSNVTVTKSDVGLGNVANTGDSATPVSGGTTKFTTGGAYTELAKKANTEGYYKDLHVGVADNLFGEAYTDDVFTLRTTAGNQDIASGDMPYGDGKVSKIEGNTVVWNQQARTLAGGSVYKFYFDIDNADGSLTYQYVTDSTSDTDRIIMPKIISGHKYYVDIKANFTSQDTATGFYCVNHQSLGTPYYIGSRIFTAAYDTPEDFLRVARLEQGKHITGYLNVILIDLTLLGIDSLTTVDEVEQWITDNIGAKEYYEYNPGELIPVKDYSIKSTGFNLWDGEVGNGWIDSNGEIQDNNSYRYSLNPIPVFPNTNYYIKTSEIVTTPVSFYTKSNTFISSVSGSNATNKVFTTPSNAAYMRFYFNGVPDDPANSTCINLSYHGDRDGEYEEHWEHTMPVDITKLTGRLNGTGEDVVVFPDGLKKAGTVRDEIVRSGGNVKAIKRIYSLKLTSDIVYSGGETGTDRWGGTNTVGFYFYTVNNNLPGCAYNNSIKTNFAYTHQYTVYNADVESVSNTSGSNNYIAIRVLKSRLIPYGFDNSSASSNINAFKAFIADNDIEFFYAIEPQEYILDDEVLPIQYRVDDYGIEEVILDNEEEVTSCSPKMTINYGLNAAKTIGDLPHEYISIHRQAIDEGHQAQARHNINAASQDDFIRIQEQLDAINPKVDNDVYVDLGLPSGLLWAKRNIDVTQPDGFASSEYTYDASFFSWGNTEGHNPTGTTFDYDFGSSNDGPYASTPGAKLTGNIGLSYDAARVNLGAPWRMPTKEDFQELFDNCDFVDANDNVIPSTTTNKLITINSIVGIRLKSKKNGKMLFLPACGWGNSTLLNVSGVVGYCWDSTYYSDTYCYYLGFSQDGVAYTSANYRYRGYPIRPVM